MDKIDIVLQTSYWNLRKLSVADFGRSHEQHYSILLQDTYMLVSNTETFYTYDAHGYFATPYDKMQYIQKYIDPLLYTFKVMDKAAVHKMPTKPIRKFMAMYGVLPISLKNFSILCAKEGLDAPYDYTYCCSKKWYDYEGSVKSLGRKMLITDWRFQNDKSSKE